MNSDTLRTSPHTQRFYDSMRPGVAALAGLAISPYAPEAGRALALAGALEGVNQLLFGGYPYPPAARGIESLNGRLAPLQKLLKKLPESYSSSWKEGYQSDYELLAATIEGVDLLIQKSELLEAESHYRVMRSYAAVYNKIIHRAALDESDKEKLRLNENLSGFNMDFSHVDLIAFRAAVRNLEEELKALSPNVDSIFPEAFKQEQQDTLLRLLTVIKERVDQSTVHLSKLNKKIKLLNQIKTIKEAIDLG